MGERGVKLCVKVRVLARLLWCFHHLYWVFCWEKGLQRWGAGGFTGTPRTPADTLAIQGGREINTPSCFILQKLEISAVLMLVQWAIWLICSQLNKDIQTKWWILLFHKKKQQQ